MYRNWIFLKRKSCNLEHIAKNVQLRNSESAQTIFFQKFETNLSEIKSRKYCLRPTRQGSKGGMRTWRPSIPGASDKRRRESRQEEQQPEVSAHRRTFFCYPCPRQQV
ncbi:unnamed protein product [Nesidiocoris tenuis]|uniref:Uncharacterized protein n=1 Tax=Nesidiocoris tenuis TaxID=355587 RepID=A0A6H5HMZ3_9HEMI|nr:unnamed protein product [Nesidiocoris tenuis]